VLTKKGVEVDLCDKCHGIWLDKGELYLFAVHPKKLSAWIQEGLKQARPSTLKSPKSDQPMLEFSVPVAGIQLDQCPDTKGIWLDGGELDQLMRTHTEVDGLVEDKTVGADETPRSIEDPSARIRMAKVATGLSPLPNLVVRSAGVLFGLYAMLVLALIVTAEVAQLPPAFPLVVGTLMIAVQFAVSPFIMDLMLRWTQGLRWVNLNELPRDLASAVERICNEQKMRVPRLGIIEDGNPNAFTYGHTPNNARLVVTRGILDLLQGDEIEGVVAHEIGHAKHWDMLIMTAAQLVPLIFYFLYRICLRTHFYGAQRSSGSGGKGSGQAEAARLAIGIGALILYVISEYLVLWLSRTREFFADRFAGRVTGKPNALASALVKIAYGMAGQEPTGKKTANRSGNLEAVGAMGLFDAKAAKSLAITSASTQSSSSGRSGEPGLGGEIDREALKEAMRWDRWNPWAKYYEIHSTHPLVANRLQYLGEQAASMKQTPFVIFNLRRPESYWDEFAVDLAVLWLPMIAGAIGFFLGLSGGLGPTAWGGLLIGLGLGGLAQLAFQYPSGHFPELSILSMLKKVKVSAVRPIPCTLEGIIIGRGVPGLVWSEDFVIQDKTGILFIDYRQPLALWEFFFGLLRAARFQNEPVTVTGWYRRAPVPYLELLTITTRDGKTRRCYTRIAKVIGAGLMVLGGLAVILFGMGV